MQMSSFFVAKTDIFYLENGSPKPPGLQTPGGVKRVIVGVVLVPGGGEEFQKGLTKGPWAVCLLQFECRQLYFVFRITEKADNITRLSLRTRTALSLEPLSSR
eukprot:PhM_4_TR2092/c0_g2_i2/m.29335